MQHVTCRTAARVCGFFLLCAASAGLYHQHVGVVCVVVGNRLIVSCNPAKHKVKMVLHQ